MALTYNRDTKLTRSSTGFLTCLLPDQTATTMRKRRPSFYFICKKTVRVCCVRGYCGCVVLLVCFLFLVVRVISAASDKTNIFPLIDSRRPEYTTKTSALINTKFILLVCSYYFCET